MEIRCGHGDERIWNIGSENEMQERSDYEIQETVNLYKLIKILNVFLMNNVPL